MIPVSLAKAAHVYLCYSHMHRFKYILRKEVITLWIKYNYLEEAVAITERIQSQVKYS